MAAKRGTALYHATTKVPLAYPKERVSEVLKRLRSQKFLSAHHVFVVNNPQERIFWGLVSTRDLLMAEDGKTMQEIARTDYPGVSALEQDQQVAVLAIRQDLDTIPVVDPQTKRFLGTVDAEDLLKILHEKHTESLLKRAGILRDEHIVDIFKARISAVLRVRLPWLLVGFVGGLLATVLVSRFEPLLKQAAALAYFIPIIAYMNAAVGTQAVSIFVRGLTMGEFSLSRHLLKEMAVGLIMGALFGFLIFGFSLLAFGSLAVAQTVGIALFAGISISTLNAMLIPYFFHKIGKDPALGSDPLVTIIQDILSILIYFWVASLLVFR